MIKKEAHTHGNDHEEIAREIVTVNKSPGDKGHPFQMQNLLMAAKEFKYPIKGFENTHEEHSNDERFDSSEAFLKKTRIEEKEKQATQSKPLEEFDLSDKGNKGNLECRCGVRIVE
jgi:hypothetical protein